MLAGAGFAAAGLFKAGQAASSLDQAMGGTEAVFGDASDAIDSFAKKAAQAIGLSEREFREATTSIGGQLKGLGFTADAAAEKAVDLTKVGADLAATYGGTTAEAVAALGSAFRGEADPAERFNLFLNQTRVNAKAVELGLAATTSEVSANAKAQATLALITEQSADALGGFSRESETAAGAQARFKAELENLSASLGAATAPILADISSGLGAVAEGYNNLPGPVRETSSKVAAYGTIALGAAGAATFLAGKLTELRGSFNKLRNLSGATGAVAAAGVGLAGLTAAAALYIETINKAEAEGDRWVTGLRSSFNPALASYDELNFAISDLTSKSQQLRDDMAGGLSGLTINRDFNAALSEGAEGADKFRAELETLRDRADTLAEQLGVNHTEALRLVTSSDVAAAATSNVTGEFDAQAAAAAAAEARIKGLADSLRAQFDPLFALSQASEALATSQTEAMVALDQYGASSLEAKSANDEAVQAALSYEGALLNVKAALEEGTVSLSTSQATLQRWVSEGKITQAQADQVSGAFNELGLKAVALDASDVEMTVTATGIDAVLAKFDALSEATGGNKLFNASITARDHLIQSTSASTAPVSSQLATGGTSQNVQIIINNPTQEPASTSIRKVRGELTG